MIHSAVPITQTAMYFDGVGLHEYESVAIDLDEQQRLVRDRQEISGLPPMKAQFD